MDGAHQETPDDEDADDTDGMTISGKSLTECADNDDHELDTV